MTAKLRSSRTSGLHSALSTGCSLSPSKESGSRHFPRHVWRCGSLGPISDLLAQNPRGLPFTPEEPDGPEEM